jgi:SAM-dependent methyltransferase
VASRSNAGGSVTVVVADHPIHAFLFDPFMSLVDRAGLADRRRRMISEARGHVVEVGGGTGRNLLLYRDVDSVTVLEPDAAMRRRLLDRVAAAAVPVEVHETSVEKSGLPDAMFDTVVASLVLCMVDDQAAALAAMKRMLKPDGRLLFLEHVRAPGMQGRVQAAATPVWSRVAAGCHLDRDTLDAIRDAGFAITDCNRSGVLVNGIAHLSKRPTAEAP